MLIVWRKLCHSAVDQMLGGRGGEGIVVEVEVFECMSLFLMQGLVGRLEGVYVDVLPEKDWIEFCEGLGVEMGRDTGSWNVTVGF